MTNERLNNVANWYNLANWLGIGSNDYIAGRLNITDRHARRLIADARTLGLLPAMASNETKKITQRRSL
jgi:DNA-binding transcriptional regulator LsrR (DeoR family)